MGKSATERRVNRRDLKEILEEIRSFEKKKKLSKEEWALVAKFWIRKRGRNPKENVLIGLIADEATEVVRKKIAEPIASMILARRNREDTVFSANRYNRDNYYADLVSEGLTKAYILAMSFDSGKGASFHSYVWKSVLGEEEQMFNKTVMQGRGLHYEKNRNNDNYHVVLDNTQSLSQAMRIKNKESKRKLEDIIPDPVASAEDIASKDMGMYIKFLAFAKANLEDSYFQALTIVLRRKSSLSDVARQLGITRQLLSTVFRKLVRDFKVKVLKEEV